MQNDPVQRALTDLDSSNPATRSAALERLRGQMDVRITPKLISLLKNRDAAIRQLAAEALSEIGDPAAVAALIDALQDEADAVRTAAAEALRKIGTPDALAAIEAWWQGAPPVTPETDEEVERGIPSSLLDDLLRNEDIAPHGIIKPEDAEASPVQFSAYSPREAAPNTWYPLRAYVFKPSAADAVGSDAAQQLGALLPSYRDVTRPALISIAEGTLITATPQLAGCQFNPPSAQIAFYEDWHRFDFKLRAVDAPLDQASNGRITFTVEGVIVADIPLSIYVGTSASDSSAITTDTRPIYQSIFCSYSRQDTQIVERVERAYKALGFDFFRDVESLKSGQDWRKELPRLIERADIFQLFWSQASAQSSAVHEEWTYALSLKRQDQAFIRPVYWQQPMPPPPSELAPINFAYEPDLGNS